MLEARCTFADFVPYAVMFSTIGFVAAVACVAILSRMDSAFASLANGLLGGKQASQPKRAGHLASREPSRISDWR